jgi:hypothetical protein
VIKIATADPAVILIVLLSHPVKNMVVSALVDNLWAIVGSEQKPWKSRFQEYSPGWAFGQESGCQGFVVRSHAS